MASRLARSRQDRIFLARFLASFLGLIALLNVAPAIYHWSSVHSAAESKIANWLCFQVLVGVLQLLYAVFVWQIRDWSALKALSVVLLFFAALYGFISTSALIGDANSIVFKFLEVSYSMQRTATIWAVTMLLLMIATSFLAMKEALNWQRIENIYQRLNESAGETRPE